MTMKEVETGQLKQRIPFTPASETKSRKLRCGKCCFSKEVLHICKIRMVGVMMMVMMMMMQ